jgi:predicted DNA-binding transcriptional regulator AlpA
MTPVQFACTVSGKLLLNGEWRGARVRKGQIASVGPDRNPDPRPRPAVCAFSLIPGLPGIACEDLLMTPVETGNDEYTRTRLAARLCIALPTLDRYRREGRLPPHYYLGRGVRWHRADVERFVRRNCVWSTSGKEGGRTDCPAKTTASSGRAESSSPGR